MARLHSAVIKPNSYVADLDMRGVDIAVWICPRRCDADAVVIVRNDVLETILFTITLQSRNQTLAFQSFLSNLLKLGKQLTFQLALQGLPLLTDKQYLTPSTPAVPNCCCSKGPAPYWSNPSFFSARMSKIKNGGLDQYGNM